MKRNFKMEVPEFREIITGRPGNMDFKRYKELRKLQCIDLKNRKRGFLVYKSSEIITKKIGGKEVKTLIKYKPFIGRVHDLSVL